MNSIITASDYDRALDNIRQYTLPKITKMRDNALAELEKIQDEAVRERKTYWIKEVHEWTKDILTLAAAAKLHVTALEAETHQRYLDGIEAGKKIVEDEIMQKYGIYNFSTHRISKARYSDTEREMIRDESIASAKKLNPHLYCQKYR